MEKIPLKIKAVYGLGSFGYLLTSTTVSVWLLRFYEDVVGLPATYIQTAYIIYGVWNLLNDPIFGYISDNTKSRLGRRRPFLIAGAPLLGLSFALLWLPPKVAEFYLFLYFTVMLCLYDAFYTIIGLVMSALLPELTLDPIERSKLSAFANVSGAIAGVIAYIVPFYFIDSLQGMAFLGVLFGIVAASLPAVTGIVVEEKFEFVYEEQPGIIDSLKYSLKNDAFRVFVAFNFMFVLMLNTFIPSISYYTKYVLGLGPTESVMAIAIVLVAAVIGFPLIIRLQKTRGSRDAMMVSLSFMIAGLLMLFFAEDMMLVRVALFVGGLGLSAPMLLVNPMIGDIVDLDELTTGVRREGMYFGVNALITKPAITVGAYIVLEVHKITGFAPKSAVQTGQAILGLKLLVSIIPAAFLLLALVFLYFYPLYGERLRRVKEAVEELHRKKRERFKSLTGQGV